MAAHADAHPHALERIGSGGFVQRCIDHLARLFGLAIGVAIAGLGVILLGADILPVPRSLALGACAAVAGIATALWPAFTLSELASDGTHIDQIGPEFLLVIAGPVWGALVFLAAGPLTGRGADVTVFSRSDSR